jgi:TPP-dependent pyruvate/acetoin dehydrogenase alpha subunit
MVVVRAFDRQATNLQRQGQLALWPPSFGQEAAQVGSVRRRARRTTSSRATASTSSRRPAASTRSTSSA